MLDDVLQIGDEVVVTVSKENRDWGYNPCPDGTKGVVVGFAKIHYSRIQSFGLKPGVYSNKCYPYVKIEGKKELSIGTFHLKMVDEREYERRVAAWREVGGSGNRMHKEELFLHDLPETKFWEGDTVRIVPRAQFKDDGSVVGADNKIMMIVGIEYGWRNKGEPRTYRISNDFGAGWHTYAKEDELVLVERGNVWKYFHNEPLQSKDIQEEANFFKMLGHYEEVRNPKTGFYSWTKDEVLEAIRVKIADGFSAGLIPLTDKVSISAIRFRDRNLGEKVRQETLKGFNLQPV